MASPLLPIGRILGAALAGPFRHPIAFLRCSVAPILSVILNNALGYYTTHGHFMATESGLRFVFPDSLRWVPPLLIVVTVCALAMFAVSWQRCVTLGDQAEPVPPIRIDRWLGQYLILGLKLLGVMLPPILAGLLVVAPILGPVPNSAQTAIFAIAVAILFFVWVWWWIGRFSLAIASAAVDRPPIRLRDSWRMTAMVRKPVIAIFLCIGLAGFLLSFLAIHLLHALMPIGFQFSLPPFILFGLANLALGLIQIGWIVGAAGEIYRQLSEPPAASDQESASGIAATRSN